MNYNLRMKAVALVLTCSLLLFLAGCGTEQTEVLSNRVTVTISYSEGDLTRAILVKIKEKFPELDIQLVNHGFQSESGDADYAFLEYLASHGGLADITLNNNLSKSLPSLADSFADLSGKAYTSRFKTSYLNDAQIDGAVYYLPFTLQVEGLIYNKTLFEERGWEAPTDYQSFATLLKTIHQETDIRPLYDEARYKTVSYWWNTYYALNEGSHLSGYRALKEFNEGVRSAIDVPTENTFAYMKLLCDTGSLVEADLSTFTGELQNSPEAFRVLGNREAAMAFASSFTLKNLKTRGSKDEFEMIPLYTPDCNEGYLLEKPSVNIAVSREASENPTKEAAIDRIMDYLTSEEGQQLLLEYSYGIKSPCYGMMDTAPRTYLEEILPAINSGYLITPRNFEHLGNAMNETFLEYLFHNEFGALQPADVLQAMDVSRKTELVTQEAEDVVLTTVTETMTRDETKYLLCKAMAEQTDSDFSVLPNMQYNNYYGTLQRSESLLTNLFAGTLSADNVHGIIYLDSPLKTYTITGEQLLKLLDYNSSGFMFYGAVLTYTYDKEKDTYYTTGATLPDGSALDVSQTYTLAASAHSELGEAISQTATDTNLYLTDAVIAYCKEQNELSPISIPESNYIK